MFRTRAGGFASVTFAEQTKSLLHIVGRARGSSGTIRFTPATGRGGRRQLVALVDNGGLPLSRPVLASFIVPSPPRPGRAGKLRITIRARAFLVTFSAPANATRALIQITSTDGRRLQRLLPIGVHRLSVPVIGFHDGIRVKVSGVSATGAHGPAVSATAKRTR